MNSSRNQICRRENDLNQKPWAYLNSPRYIPRHLPEQQNEIPDYGNGRTQVWGLLVSGLSGRRCRRFNGPFLWPWIVSQSTVRGVTSDGKLQEPLGRGRVRTPSEEEQPWLCTLCPPTLSFNTFHFIAHDVIVVDHRGLFTFGFRLFLKRISGQSCTICILEKKAEQSKVTSL